ncbi:hypothetical protein F0562_030525 [Nyssa sinensis]|uniref:Leucine-rich repeat-containing N-terminal plant-type domain-containing protein n=1 Tax=Nyssa sinensis TaxID=561372 RepID=A0A5J5B0T8_9ASTE|nr:hypothetical protein F0562_030525 [Nyssa sinensis]
MERCAVILLFTMLLIKSCMVWFAMSSSNFTDQSVLLAFKSKIRFDPTNVLAHNWTTSTNFCHWIGVTCSTRRQRATVLDLGYMGLQGTISPHLANLSFLVLLDLSNNSFQGQLPPEFSHLRRLKELNLAHNQIEGVIPPSLHHCRRLQAILLEYNNFTSGIPKEFGILPKLRGLSLSGNSLSGSIPSSIGNISTLDNSISGTLPKDLCSNCPKLQRLSLYYNHISGHIPSTIYQCTELTHLVLYYNSFNGTIPAEVGRLHKLKRLNIGVNNIFGTIPPSLGNISSLDQIYMGTNYIHGVIPNKLEGLSNLIDFNLGKNFLSGVIPSAIFNISSLESLSFAYNAFSGTLPTTIGLQLPNLQQFLAQGNQLGGIIPLYLSNSSKLARLTLEANLFTGPVPKSLGNLEQLSWFNVGGNQLTGETGSPELHFLTALTNCRSLKWLIVDYNPLDGIIPNSIGNNSSPLQTFSAFSCQIKGHIPRGVGTFRNLNFIDLSNNNLNGTIPSTIVGLESLQRLYLEYGSEGRVSTRGDIFSYGIMLLETVTRKKPTDEMFTGELSLRHWVNASLPDKLMEVVDCGLLRIKNGDMTATQDNLLAIMELGLECCKELPEERNDIQEVVSKLNKIKLQLICNRRT